MKAIILAAGKGKRLGSEEAMLPKVMRRANNKPLLEYVLNSVDFLEKADIILVVGYMMNKITSAFPEYPFCVQDEQKGTGHAVKCAEELLKDYSGNVMVLCGDAPLTKKSTLKKLMDFHESCGNDCTILSSHVDKELKLGRIVRDMSGAFIGIVENQDCDSEQIKITEYNTAIYIFDSKKLFASLNELRCDNKQNEYYLTDVPKIFMNKSYKVGVLPEADEYELMGANTIEDLLEIERILMS
ncbi:MAG: NTP transferase domain-containing protein [Eubacteriales bacterium]